MRSRPTYFLVVLIVSVLAFVYFLINYKQSLEVSKQDIATFEECIAAGYPVAESYPEQCRTPEGQTFTRVTPIDTPSKVTLTGIYTCLPKKNTGGPVTMECAFGLQTDGGYYALDVSSIPSEDYPALSGNESVTIEGTLVPIEMVSSDRWQSYDAIGIVAVDKITKK